MKVLMRGQLFSGERYWGRVQPCSKPINEYPNLKFFSRPLCTEVTAFLFTFKRIRKSGFYDVYTGNFDVAVVVNSILA